MFTIKRGRPEGMHFSSLLVLLLGKRDFLGERHKIVIWSQVSTPQHTLHTQVHIHRLFLNDSLYWHNMRFKIGTTPGNKNIRCTMYYK